MVSTPRRIANASPRSSSVDKEGICVRLSSPAPVGVPEAFGALTGVLRGRPRFLGWAMVETGSARLVPCCCGGGGPVGAAACPLLAANLPRFGRGVAGGLAVGSDPASVSGRRASPACLPSSGAAGCCCSCAAAIRASMGRLGEGEDPVAPALAGGPPAPPGGSAWGPPGRSAFAASSEAFRGLCKRHRTRASVYIYAYIYNYISHIPVPAPKQSALCSFQPCDVPLERRAGEQIEYSCSRGP